MFASIVFVHLYLIIRYFNMNKEKKIERLERQLAKLREENRQLKSDVRKVKKDSSNENKKKDVRTITLSEEQEKLLSDLLGDISSQS